MLQIELLNAIVVGVVLLTVTIYKYITWNNNYWKKRNVPFVPPMPIVGNGLDFILSKRTLGEIYQQHYNEYPDEKYVGLFRMRSPTLMIKDPDLLKYVFIKNFSCFQNRFEDHNELKERLSANMFTATSEKWRSSRQKLTPTFTSGKLRNMFYLILEKGEELRRCLDIMTENDEEVQVHELMAKYTTEVIGSCAFGLQLNSMLDTEEPFRRIGRLMFDINFKRNLKTIFRMLSPAVFYALGLKVFPQPVEDFFVKIVKDMMQQRKNSPSKRNDFIDLLLELKHQNNKDDPEMDDMFMAAQAFIFFGAGFETSSMVMSATLQELSENPDIQERVFNEICTVLEKHDGKITYDSIVEMEYLDMVMSETLRKHPVLGFIPRTCTTTNKLPDSDLVIEKGMNITIPVLALHKDPKYFPDPEKFNPERFTAEAKRERHPMVYLPFGEGPRNCVGLRFGKMQSKVGLIYVLQNYKFEVSKNTKPIIFKPRNFVSTPQDGVTLYARKRNVQT